MTLIKEIYFFVGLSFFSRIDLLQRSSGCDPQWLVPPRVIGATKAEIELFSDCENVLLNRKGHVAISFGKNLL